MKTKILLLCALFFIQYVSASEAVLTIKTQLEKLNKYWKIQNVNDPVLNETTLLADEVTLIQTHLMLVEKTLRNKNTTHLSANQLKNRLKCLDILHNYWKKGLFPKNLYHATRTPYFIDKYGTACAVGQLIISTGFGEFAQKVSQENNYAYITELNLTYSEIKNWANTFGFTIEELAWIQPCYCNSTIAATINPDCSEGGNGGYFMPDLSNLPAPHTWTLYIWKNNTWEIPMVFCAPCDLGIGSYKMSVKDANGLMHDFFATLTGPPPPVINITVSGNYNNCTATASVSVSGGFPPYSYYWGVTPTSTTNIATGLCEKVYYMSVNDSKPCNYLRQFTVGNPTALKELSDSDLKIFPNPVSTSLQIRLSESFIGKTSAVLYNALGQQSGNFNLDFAENTIDIEQFNPGVYFLLISNGKNVVSEKVVVSR